MAKYRNSFHKPFDTSYGPEFYETEVRATEYRGHLIYHRQANCWDVVKDGECVAQMAGPDGAKRRIDAVIAGQAAEVIAHPSEEYHPDELHPEPPLFAAAQ